MRLTRRPLADDIERMLDTIDRRRLRKPAVKAVRRLRRWASAPRAHGANMGETTARLPP